jgi:hypothetical protein
MKKEKSLLRPMFPPAAHASYLPATTPAWATDAFIGKIKSQYIFLKPPFFV